MAELSTGTVLLGHSYSYRIEHTLGSGTFGITYLAVVSNGAGPMNGKMRVCIKEFFMHDINGRRGCEVTCSSNDGMYAEYRRKFLREAKNLASINHEHIIHVLEAFEQNNTVYYVMEFIAGGSLDSYIASHGCMAEAEAMRCMAGIAEGLQYMHSKKMLHLDLKPANIMLKTDGTPVLIDFGLSKQYNAHGEPESSTKVGSGTPGYAPVEQSNYHDGNGFPVTMDVYALGGTLFKMLTGQRPPDSSVVLNDGLPVGLLRQRGVSQATIAAIEGAMTPIVRQRTPNVAAFVKALPTVATRKAAQKEKSSSSHSPNAAKASDHPTKPRDIGRNLSEGPVYITPDTTRMSIILSGKEDVVVVFTPQKITVLADDDNKLRSYISSRQRFASVIKRINALHLHVTRTFPAIDANSDCGVTSILIAERDNKEYIHAVAPSVKRLLLFEDDGCNYYLQGDTAALADIVEKETLVDVSSRKKKSKSYIKIAAIICAAAMMATAVALWMHTYNNNANSYTQTSYSAEQSDHADNVAKSDSAEDVPEICNEREVNLALPSGTVWAGWNVGASSAEQCGNYYAWGETRIKTEYTNENYFDLANGRDFEDFTTYYNEGGKTSIRCTSRDVAWKNWGHDWAMPTKEQAAELVSECSWTWMKYGDMYGYAVTGPNGKSLFLPAAGEHYTGINNEKDVNAVINVGEKGGYWTSDLYKTYSASATIISFVPKKHEIDADWRTSGRPVRAVKVKKEK